jgi:hypothetical protein
MARDVAAFNLPARVERLFGGQRVEPAPSQFGANGDRPNPLAAILPLSIDLW